MESGADLRRLSLVAVVFGVFLVAAPLTAVAAYAVTAPLVSAFGAARDPVLLALVLPALVATVAGFVAFFVFSIQVPLVIIAAVGGRLAGRPLDLRQSLRRARQVFWRAIGTSVLVGVIAGVPALIISLFIYELLGGETQLSLGLNLLVSIAVASPWVYVLPGIVLGGVGVGESIRRSWRLARLRWRLALTVSVLAVVGQQIVLAAALAAIGAVITVAAVAPGGVEVAAAGGPLLIAGAVLAAAVVLSSLLFATSAVQVAPETSGFFALTRYSDGLDDARGEPREPWLRPPAAVLYGAGLLATIALATNLLAAWPISERGPWQAVEVGGRAMEIPAGWTSAGQVDRTTGYASEGGGAVAVTVAGDAGSREDLARRHLELFVSFFDEVVETSAEEADVEGHTVQVATYEGSSAAMEGLPFEFTFPVLVMVGRVGGGDVAVTISYPAAEDPLREFYLSEAERFARHVWRSALGGP